MPFEDYEGAIFGTTWKGAARRYGVVSERDVRVPMPDGVELSCDIWRPDTEERIPAILSFHPYHQQAQTGPIRPTAISTAQWLTQGKRGPTRRSSQANRRSSRAGLCPRRLQRPGDRPVGR